MGFGSDIIRFLAPDEGEVPIIDYVTNSLFYIGFANNADATEDVAQWLIYRVNHIKGVVKTTFITQEFDQIWDNRYILFKDNDTSKTENPAGVIEVNSRGASKVYIDPVQANLFEEMIIQLKINNEILNKVHNLEIDEDAIN